jgi:hypothetical protein
MCCSRSGVWPVDPSAGHRPTGPLSKKVTRIRHGLPSFVAAFAPREGRSRGVRPLGAIGAKQLGCFTRPLPAAKLPRSDRFEARRLTLVRERGSAETQKCDSHATLTRPKICNVQWSGGERQSAPGAARADVRGVVPDRNPFVPPPPTSPRRRQSRGPAMTEHRARRPRLQFAIASRFRSIARLRRRPRLAACWRRQVGH